MELLEPRSVGEATSLLAEHGDEARIIAGGTAVVLMLQNRLISPAYLVSLGRIEGLDSIEYEPGIGLRIGPLATLRQAETSPLVRKHAPLLAETLATVANVRVRNAATVGGNLSEADYASDPPGAMLALRARVRATSSRGEREIPLDEFFKDFYETALAQDEVVTEVVVPEAGVNARGSYIKYVSRSSEDRPCVGVAALVELDPVETDSVCRELRVVVNAVAETPRELRDVEKMAQGRRLTSELIREVAEGYAEAIDPLSDMRGSAWYRKQMIGVFVRRAVEAAAGGQGADSEE
jgi:carbon-monoxide dehydrogenase medium subunit